MPKVTVDTDSVEFIEAIIDALDEAQWDQIEIAKRAVAEISGMTYVRKELTDVGPGVRSIRRRQYVDTAERIRRRIEKM